MANIWHRHQAIGFVTPLRYPGGKRKIFPFFRDLLTHNDLVGSHYVEPFAGGAGLALSLLLSGYVEFVHLNDLDVSIYIFWKTVLEHTEELCRRIETIPVDIETWQRQREVIEHPKRYTEIEVALAALFLNRTNRSGILRGGVIGGKKQEGKWKMDARFNKGELIMRIHRIALYRDKIRVYNHEALEFLQRIPSFGPAPKKMIIYADPPYYAKGHTLYYNHYQHSDHQRLGEAMKELPFPWVVSYDDVKPVYEFYQDMPYLHYQLHYTAQTRRRSGEVMFFQNLEIPPVEDKRRWHPMYVLESSISTALA